MQSPKFLIILSLLIVLSGCGGGCVSVPKAFVEGEQAAYGAIAPIYARYVTNDDTLSEEEREGRLRTVRAWKFALDKHAEASEVKSE